MGKISIYFGPRKGLIKLIDASITWITLTDLAIASDKKMREHSFKTANRKNIEPEREELEVSKKIKIKGLVAYTEEYAALSENAIQGFLSFLSQYDIEEVFLQNPPKHIISQLNNINDDVRVYAYGYNTLDKEVIKAINEEYDNVIIGQKKVKKRLMSALYPLCGKETKPVVLLFYGSTGVGKTETAKFLSSLLNQKLLRRQFSMFNSSDFSSYLFGGKHNQACLARDLLERESNIILFDEFDKANPLFYSAFYQMFDEGVYEDKNYYVTLDKSIIICTSNFMSIDEIKQKLGAPIFYRFDAVIKFDDIGKDAIKEIMRREYFKYVKGLELEEQEKVETEKTLDKLIENIDSIDNTRDLKNIIRERISDTLIEEIIK